jgi:hypothetical protein
MRAPLCEPKKRARSDGRAVRVAARWSGGDGEEGTAWVAAIKIKEEEEDKTRVYVYGWTI